MNSTQYLRNLLVMAMADGSLGEREVIFLTDRCADLGLDESELRNAIRYALEDNAAVDLPTTIADQEALLVDLLRVMAADGVLAETEKRLFALSAAKLGFDAERVDALVNRTLSQAKI